MNYRHAFHAGNFADVCKHALLVELLDALTAKDKPLCYLEAHAGAGCYRLGQDESGRTGEYLQGIARLQGSTPKALAPYLSVIAEVNRDRAPPGLYPGSPLIAAHRLRATDRLVLCELQPDPAALLRELFARDARVGVHQRDGYGALKAFLPPAERRALVLIDPPFEAQDAEFVAIEAALKEALVRFPGGTYAVWYPIKRRQLLRPFHRRLSLLKAKSVLAAELLVHADDSPLRLNGSGLAIVNPPWRIEQRLEPVLRALHPLLSHGRGSGWHVDWIRREAS